MIGKNSKCYKRIKIWVFLLPSKFNVVKVDIKFDIAVEIVAFEKSDILASTYGSTILRLIKTKTFIVFYK